KQNIAGTLILADAPEQVPLLEEKILANDRADPKGELVEEIVTVPDFLPGPPAEQQAKLAVLERIRDRLTPRVLHEVDDDERARLEEMRPPDDMDIVGPEDLPLLIRR